MKIIIGFFLILFCTVACAEEMTIESRYMDLTPNDGFMDAGSYSNPYEVQDYYGNTRATIAPRYMDFDPDDGFMDAGTPINPYVVDWDN